MARLLRALYDPDENIVQRWFGDFKRSILIPSRAAKARKTSCGLVPDANDKCQSPLTCALPARRARSKVALPRDGHGVARKAMLDLIDLAVQHGAALIDQRMRLHKAST